MVAYNPRVLKYLTIAGLLVASMLSGSRATFAISLCFVLFAVSIELAKLNLFSRLLNVFFLLSLFVLVFYQSIFVQNAFDNILLRFKSGTATNEYDARTFGILEEVINFRGDNALTGLGLGSTYQGANAVWGISRYVKQYPGGYEEEPERIVLEGGYLLLIFKLGLIFLFFFKTKIPKLFFLFVFAFQFVTFPIVFNVYNAFFFFIGMAVLDRAYRKYIGLA